MGTALQEPMMSGPQKANTCAAMCLWMSELSCECYKVVRYEAVALPSALHDADKCIAQYQKFAKRDANTGMIPHIGVSAMVLESLLQYARTGSGLMTETRIRL